MGRFNDYLSKLNVGDSVKITQSNGQVIEGIIINNDGEEALSLQINATAMIRYQAVEAITVIAGGKNTGDVSEISNEEVKEKKIIPVVKSYIQDKEPLQTSSKAEKVIKEPVSLLDVKPLLSKNKLYDEELTEDTVKEYFAELNEPNKGLLKSTFDTLMNNYENDDEPGMSSAANNLIKLCESRSGSEYHKAVRIAAGCCYLVGDYENAVKLFYYGNHIRDAYVSAFNAAYRLNEDVILYSMAGAFSVLYMLTEQNEEHLPEAASCLKEVCIKCKDISGLKFLLENHNTDLQLAYTYEVLKKVCEKIRINFSDDIDSVISSIESKYDQSIVYDSIIKVEKDKIEYEQQLVTKTQNISSVPNSQNVESTDSEGQIVKLNFFEDKGKITGNSGKTYEFEFVDVTDNAFRKQIKNLAGKSKKDISIPVKFEVDTTYKKLVAVKIQKKESTQSATTSIQPPTVNASSAPNKLFTDQQAKYYYSMSGFNNKKPDLKKRIEELEKKQKAVRVEIPGITLNETIPEEFQDELTTEGISSVSSVIEEVVEDESTDLEDIEVSEYKDETAFKKLITSDKTIIDTALGFDKAHQDCMVTYLAAAAKISEMYGDDRKSEYSETTVSDMIISVSELINAAFDAYGFAKHSDADKLVYHYQNCRLSVPDISDELLMSAVLRTAFSDHTVQSFEINQLTSYIEKIPVNQYKTAVLSLIELFKSFFAQTGYPMDMFADYNTNSSSVQNIIDDAKECQRYIEQRVKSYESQGQLRRARELMLYDENSIISIGLKSVCDNDIGRVSYIKKEIVSAFLRNSDEISTDNIDVKKLDAFIDSRWDMARDLILSEKRHINRPYDNLKGGKRNNIIIIIKKAIDCVCRWLNIADNAAVTKDVYSFGQYADRRTSVQDNLEILNVKLSAEINGNFNWGTYSLYSTVCELISKIDGSFNPAVKKYTAYSGFLKTNDVLLDEDFVPEISSTFSDLSGFDIFSRIRAYADSKLPEFKFRIKQIFSDNIHNSNFRCADLIRQYGEFFKITEITDDPLYNDLDECIRSSKKRTTYFYKDFKNELELDESYGSISDVSGYKSFVENNIDLWYSYAMSSSDFGFFSDLIEAYRTSISENAESKAKKLAEQLADLAEDSKYDFGIYTIQQIRDHIEDRNFAIAENILNCIRRGDTKNISDFTEEPKGIFDGFMAEYDSLYRAVSDTKVHLQKSLMTYFGKKNIEIVLKRVTNNMNKDVRGGIALINSWPIIYPAGVDKISKFVSLLGFTNAEVTQDKSFAKEDIYLVSRKKRTGKITYPHPIPAFGSLSEEEGLRILVLYGRFDTDRLLDKFREINTVSKNTIVVLDSVLDQEERKRFARKIKEEKSFSRSFIVIDRVLLFYLAKHYQSNTISRMLMATTMPFSFNQPFCPKPNAPLPGELFTGRKEELNLIESYNGVNLVYGGRQLGKSSLLKMAEHNIDRNSSGDRAIVIGIKDRNYTEAALKVSRELIMNDILPEGAECNDWDTLAMHISKRLRDDSNSRINYLLIMLDEADCFIESCREINYRPITALKDMISPRFKFVLAGLHNLSKYNYEAVYSNNSDIAHLESLVVRPFKRPEATELLTNALGYLGFVFNEDVVNLILAKTNYFPGLIHLYAQKLLSAMSNEDYAGYSEMETPYYYVTESHIKKVLADQNFKDEINNKLNMTLEVNGKDDSPYYIIALLLAYLYYEETGRKTEFTIDNIIEKAKTNEINFLIKFTREQISEFLHEMWDLNILSCRGEYYMFSTDGFRELLGTKSEVNNELARYIGR